MATSTRNDDHLSLGDALRSLDAYPDTEGADTLVCGQDVFDLLAHRGLLKDGAATPAVPGSLEEVRAWLSEWRGCVIEDNEPWDELSEILDRAEVVALAPGTTLTAKTKQTGVPLRFMVARLADHDGVFLSAADGHNYELGQVDLRSITGIVPPPSVEAS